MKCFYRIIKYFNLTKPFETSENSNSCYTKADAVIAISYYIFLYLVMVVMGYVYRGNSYIAHAKVLANRDYRLLLFSLPHIAVVLIPLFIILRIRKQSLKSVGLSLSGLSKSIILGVIVSMPYFSISAFKPHLGNEYFYWDILYYFVSVGLIEEIYMRGFFQPRLLVLFKTNSKWIGILLGGWLFSILHVPSESALNGGPLWGIFTGNTFIGFGHIIRHTLYFYLYTRFDNVAAPTILHTVWNIYAKYLNI